MASIAPGLDGYIAAQQLGQQREAQQIGILSRLVEMQRAQQQGARQRQEYAQEEKMRGALSSLAPDATNEQRIAAVTPYAKPDTLLRMAQGSQDRNAMMEAKRMEGAALREQRAHEIEIRGQQAIDRVREQAAQNRITREEADRREAAMRENMARLAASLRPAPAVQPLVPIVRDGKQVLVERRDAVGQMPAGAGSKAEAIEAGKSEIDRDVATLKSAIDSLKEGGGMTSTSKGVVPNVMAWASNTGPGQVLGSAGGTYNQKARDVIAQARPLLLRSIMQATGMSARSLDSNAELKLWLSTATDPTKGYEANIEALNNIAAKYGSGAILDAPPAKPIGGDRRSAPRDSNKRIVVDY